MPSRLADRLSRERRRRFVGRGAEVRLFRAALTAADLPFFVLHIFGPGGVGKSTLLRRFAWECEQHRIPALLIDGRNLDPSPDAFLAALGQGLATPPQRQVILVDTYETLAPLDGWLRNQFLPELPDNVLVVLAGREPPAMAWRVDPGWQALTRVVALRNLNQDESLQYLGLRKVPAEQHRSVLDFTCGHPLALSLVADVFEQRANRNFVAENEPDVVKILLDQFVREVPSAAHRAALEACALVRVTTEALLATLLAVSDAHDLFQWLRGLSFIESHPGGLAPHDLVRDALARDIRWRNRSWYAELHGRARSYYMARLQGPPGEAQQRAMMDYVYLHRDNPVVQPFFEWRTSGGALPGVMETRDQPELLKMIAQHEGAASAELAREWLESGAAATLVFRDLEEQPVGLLTLVALEQVPREDRERDPATRAAWRFLERNAPLRSGEAATLFRFWMARESYQGVSPVQSLIFINMVSHYLTTPGLAFTFLPCADPEFWAPVFAYADLARLPDADFWILEKHFGVYGHDWRAVPPLRWLDLLAEREISLSTEAPSPASVESLIVLSRGDFEEAVLDILRNFTRPETLGENPLLRARLVTGAGPDSSADSPVETLRRLVTASAEQLKVSPRDLKFYGVLYHTYLHPAPTQEKTAELLDLPLSTYRRYLRTALARVTETLWQLEVGNLEELRL